MVESIQRNLLSQINTLVKEFGLFLILILRDTRCRWIAITKNNNFGDVITWNDGEFIALQRIIQYFLNIFVLKMSEN